MLTLLIYMNDGRWVAAPANSGVEYAFVDDQVEAVQELAEAMQAGRAAVVAEVGDIFVLQPGTDLEGVVDTLFNTTDSLTFAETVVFETEGEDMLVNELVECGDALAAAIIAFKK